jgi:hypothetical protein
MTTLLALPEVDQLQLTELELAGITGTPQHKLQVDWLRANAWAFSLTRSGRPVVGRLYANLKLSGVEVKTMIQAEEWTPAMEAIS